MTSTLIEGTEHVVKNYDDDTGTGRTACGKPIGPMDLGPRFDLVITCARCKKLEDVRLDKARAKPAARTFLADFKTKGVQTVMVRNCGSKAEAKRKLLGFYAGTLTEVEAKDVEFIHAEVTQSFPQRAKIAEDKS